MTDLSIGYDALRQPLDTEPLPEPEVRSGAPRAGSLPIGEYAGCEVGVWEMTPGVATDVEADELFVVLTGLADIRFPAEDRAIAIGPGSVVRLHAGQRTEWAVTETLRKVYLSLD